ncbi:DUF1554 domain-containing protein [Candidatus Amarolinea aalborgensis]|uniref:DUF1554 domain-containing protein n=1 Tax=Candidatus Amarolinea aalborgensis TaxID=2249329 RepID=UPI003BFA2449
MFKTILKRTRISARPATLLVTVLVLALVGGTALAAPSALSRLFEPAASPPTLVSYQGYVKVSSVAYSGTGYFKFAVMDAASGNGATNYWANDGAASGEPSASVALTVDSGLFNVMLGDTSLAGMTQPLTQGAFNQTITYLRVWFSQSAGGPFQALDPNQRIGSVAYALRAERALTSDIALGVGDNTNACTSALSGNLRWTGSVYQLCDGISWRTVQLSEGKVVLYQANNAIAIVGGAIGGRTGADTLCQSASNKPAGYSSYRAFISVSATDEIRDMPANYGVPTSYAVRSTNNTLIASNWSDLLDGSINTYLAAAGVYVNGPYDWWSGSLQDGSLDGVNCASWTNLNAPGRSGRFEYSNSNWIYAAVYGCNSGANLLCIAY